MSGRARHSIALAHVVADGGDGIEGTDVILAERWRRNRWPHMFPMLPPEIWFVILGWCKRADWLPPTAASEAI
jgi:hypothetical protein